MIVVLAVVVGAAVFVVTLPPPLSIQEGAGQGMMVANFPTTTDTRYPAFGNASATTYANQTTGSSSSVTLVVKGHAYSVAPNYVMGYVQVWYEVAVFGRIAPNLRPSGLQFTCTVTGAHLATDFYNNWTQGANVSVDNQEAIGFGNNGTGSLNAALVNAGGPGPVYAFAYGAHGQSEMQYQYRQSVEFRATVTGWMLPPIRVSVVLTITNVPKTVLLSPAGSQWYADSPLNSTKLNVATSVPYTITGAMNATTPVTAYVLNGTEYWDYFDTWVVPAWHWSLSIGTSSTPVALTLPSGDFWIMVYRTASPSATAPPVSIYATQDLIAAT